MHVNFDKFSEGVKMCRFSFWVVHNMSSRCRSFKTSWTFTGILVGDELLIDGGMATFQVTEKTGNDLHCKCTDPGLLLPRAKLSFWRNGKLVEMNFGLPTLSPKVNYLILNTVLLFFFLLVHFTCVVPLPSEHNIVLLVKM
jgi:hypothetical protein